MKKQLSYLVYKTRFNENPLQISQITQPEQLNIHLKTLYLYLLYLFLLLFPLSRISPPVFRFRSLDSLFFPPFFSSTQINKMLPVSSQARSHRLRCSFGQRTRPLQTPLRSPLVIRGSRVPENAPDWQESEHIGRLRSGAARQVPGEEVCVCVHWTGVSQLLFSIFKHQFFFFFFFKRICFDIKYNDLRTYISFSLISISHGMNILRSSLNRNTHFKKSLKILQ